MIRPLLVELVSERAKEHHHHHHQHLFFSYDQVGTGLFILIGMWGACSGGGVLAAALSFGLALMVFAASFGHISGVHFNPAVTIGVLIAGEIQAIMAILYIVMQLLGGKNRCDEKKTEKITKMFDELGLAAGGLLRLLLPNRVFDGCAGGATLLTKYPSVNTTVNGVVQVMDDGVTIWQVRSLHFSMNQSFEDFSFSREL